MNEDLEAEIYKSGRSMTNPTGLAEPLADALDVAYDEQYYAELIGATRDPIERIVPQILAALRSDPQTLAVIAEALHETAGRNHNLGEGVLRGICPGGLYHGARAILVANFLFGEAPQ